MAITFSCSCGKKLKVQDTMVGKKVRCPECNAISLARAEEESAVAEVSEDEGTVRTKARDTESLKVPPQVPAKKKKRVFRIRTPTRATRTSATCASPSAR